MSVARQVASSVAKPVVRQLVKSAGGGGEVAYSVEAQQFFDRWLTPPTTEQANVYAALIDGMVTDGLWDKTDQLLVFASFDLAIALTNVKSSNFAASITGTAPFVENRGITGSGIFNCVNTGFNPATAGGVFTQNNAAFATWSLTDSLVTKQCVRLSSGGSSINQWLRYLNGVDYHYTTLNGTNGIGAANNNSSGFFISNRTSSSAVACYRDGVTIASGSDNSVALANANILTASDDRQIAIHWIGSSLDSTERAALRSRIATYLSTVGAI